MPSKPFLAITHLSPPPLTNCTVYRSTAKKRDFGFFFAQDILMEFFISSITLQKQWSAHVERDIRKCKGRCCCDRYSVESHCSHCHLMLIVPIWKDTQVHQIVLKSHTPYYANCAQCAKSFTPLWHSHIYSAWSWDLLCQLKLICHTLLTPLYPTIYEVILHTLTEANIPLSARKWAIFCRFILLTMAWDEITYKRPFREILVYIEEQHLLEATGITAPCKQRSSWTNSFPIIMFPFLKS